MHKLSRSSIRNYSTNWALRLHLRRACDGYSYVLGAEGRHSPGETVRFAPLKHLQIRIRMLYDLTAIDERGRTHRDGQPPSDFTVVYLPLLV